MTDNDNSDQNMTMRTEEDRFKKKKKKEGGGQKGDKKEHNWMEMGKWLEKAKKNRASFPRFLP